MESQPHEVTASYGSPGELLAYAAVKSTPLNPLVPNELSSFH